MENKTTSVEDLFYRLKEYGDTRLDLLKLKSINKASSFLSNLIVSIALIVVLFFILICITIGVALLIGSLLGEAYYGFFIIAVVYIIIGLILYSGRDKYLKTPISNKLIKELID